jgi:hypothetical protein
MVETLTAKNWVKYGECSGCGRGGKKEYFSNTAYPGYVIRIRQKKGTFVILKDNLVIGGPFYGYQLEEKIAQYVL